VQSLFWVLYSMILFALKPLFINNAQSIKINLLILKCVRIETPYIKEFRRTINITSYSIHIHFTRLVSSPIHYTELVNRVSAWSKDWAACLLVTITWFTLGGAVWNTFLSRLNVPYWLSPSSPACLLKPVKLLKLFPNILLTKGVHSVFYRIN
jgi:hypothetical protein